MVLIVMLTEIRCQRPGYTTVIQFPNHEPSSYLPVWIATRRKCNQTYKFRYQ